MLREGWNLPLREAGLLLGATVLGLSQDSTGGCEHRLLELL